MKHKQSEKNTHVIFIFDRNKGKNTLLFLYWCRLLTAGQLLEAGTDLTQMFVICHVPLNDQWQQINERNTR